MVVAVHCPKCGKYMLIEDEQRGQVTPCLVCKEPIRVPAEPSAKPPTASR